MSKREKILLKLLSGNADNNFDLNDLIQVLLLYDFEERKTGGSHRIFTKAKIEGIINLQKTKDSKAKPYQVKQVRDFLIANKIISDE
jgi:predicted RNA binding protein YcfA (HicA-like mRNA interferase family)